jgi:hypothetical protein
MRFQLVASLAALATTLSPFINAAPVESDPVQEPEHWSYNDIYQYAIKHGGVNHPVTELVAKYVSTSLNSFLVMST